MLKHFYFGSWELAVASQFRRISVRLVTVSWLVCAKRKAPVQQWRMKYESPRQNSDPPSARDFKKTTLFLGQFRNSTFAELAVNSLRTLPSGKPGWSSQSPNRQPVANQP